MDIFEEYYDKHHLDENSDFSHLSKKHLVIEVDYLHNTLVDIEKYLEESGTDLDIIRGKVMDGLYESRI